MTIASTILDAAYQRSSQNDPGKLAGDTELLGHLDRMYCRVWTMLARARPENFASTSALTLGGNPAFVTLPADTMDVTNILNATLAQVHVIPPDERARLWHMAPCVYRLGMRLLTRGLAGDPVAGNVLTLTILDMPTHLTTLATALDARYPTRHEQVLIDLLGVYLSVKDDGRSHADREAVRQELMLSAAAMAVDYRLPPAAIEWLHEPAARGTA